MRSLQEDIESALRDLKICGSNPAVFSELYRSFPSSWLSSRAPGVRSRPQIVGLCGPPGSGKSSIAIVLKSLLEHRANISVAVLSLDDFYMSRQARELSAMEVHPLLRTRGVPGTHNTQLLQRVIQQLLAAKGGDKVSLPRFDKLRDELLPLAEWEDFHGRPDIILLEGWCVGATPQSRDELKSPVNDLERDHDRDARWRTHVNNCLATEYQSIFRLDQLWLLCPPSFEQVFQWRKEQEQRMVRDAIEAGRVPLTRGDSELRWFLGHFERLIGHILTSMPKRADFDHPAW